MSYLGSWKIDDVLTFPAITHRFDTGALTDADAVPAYRVYEDETGTALLTGNMAKLDDANTTGFYTEAITLSAANGFEKGKCYTIYISAAVNSVTGGQHHTFQIEAEVDANTVSGAVPSVTGAVGSVTGNVGGNVVGTIGGLTQAALADFFDTDSGTTYAAAVAGSVVKETADNAGGSSLTLGDIADAVWDEALAGHLAAGSTGEALNNSGGLSANDVADAVLKRDWTAISGEADYSVLQALRAIRNNYGVNASAVLTVYKEDGTTVAFTKQLSTSTPVRGITGATET